MGNRHTSSYKQKGDDIVFAGLRVLATADEVCCPGAWSINRSKNQSNVIDHRGWPPPSGGKKSCYWHGWAIRPMCLGPGSPGRGVVSQPLTGPIPPVSRLRKRPLSTVVMDSVLLGGKARNWPCPRRQKIWEGRVQFYWACPTGAAILSVAFSGSRRRGHIKHVAGGDQISHHKIGRSGKDGTNSDSSVWDILWKKKISN